MKTLYLCQGSSGLFAFTYAENDEEATSYFHELFEQFNPTWFNCTLKIWASPDGWTLPGTEEEYEADPPKHPYELDEVKEQLQGFKERREQRKLKQLKKRYETHLKKEVQ
jgi:hypothetical protein